MKNVCDFLHRREMRFVVLSLVLLPLWAGGSLSAPPEISDSRVIVGDNNGEKQETPQTKKRRYYNENVDLNAEINNHDYPSTTGYALSRKLFPEYMWASLSFQDLRIEEDAHWTLIMLRLKLIDGEFRHYEKNPRLQARYFVRLRCFIERLDSMIMQSLYLKHKMIPAQDIFFIDQCMNDFDEYDNDRSKNMIYREEYNRSVRTGREVWDCIVDKWVLLGRPPTGLSALSGPGGYWQEGLIITEPKTGVALSNCYFVGPREDGSLALFFQTSTTDYKIYSEPIDGESSSEGEKETSAP